MGETDLISRQAAIDAIQRHIHYDDYDYPVVDEDDVIKVLTGLPSAQPERKKGKWHSRIYSQIEMFVCSECQHEYSYDAETGEQFYNYCPNCGAKMER